MIVANPFVYEKSYLSDIKGPNITSLLEECYAQCGEDLIVLSLLNAFITTGKITDISQGICVEIGANHGYAGSNTYLIGQRFGISSVLVEANPELIDDLKKARPNDIVANFAVVNSNDAFVDLAISNHSEISSLRRDFVEMWHEGNIGVKKTCSVPAIRINTLLEKHIADSSNLLYLTIDVEGLDFTLIQDLDFEEWRPAFIQMEPSEHYAPGESARMIEFMSSNGYFLISKTNVNLIFLDSSILEHDNERKEYYEKIKNENKIIKKEMHSIRKKHDDLIAKIQNYKDKAKRIFYPLYIIYLLYKKQTNKNK